MAIIPHPSIFSWEDVENLGELERLKLVVQNVPDEALMRTLEAQRGKGRNDYPVRAVWNSVLAGVVYQHPSIESLRRELLRNGQLRQLCGFDPVLSARQAVPPSCAYTRFLKNLMGQQDQIDGMFNTLVESLRELLPGFGVDLAGDSKAVETHGNPRGKERQEELKELAPDGRRDVDADFGKKTYKGKGKDGTLWEKVVKWFGYKLHLIVDADYELPVAYEVTRASAADNTTMKRMIDDMEEAHPGLLEAAQNFMADKAYDDSKFLEKLWDSHGIRPVVDIRNLWKDGEETKLVPHTGNVLYDYKGQVFCCCRSDGELRAMAYQGYEADRDSQKWRCPAAAYDYECPDKERCCGQSQFGRVVRIPCCTDPRVFTPLARPSYTWEREYKKRTSVERVNSRLDVSFGFENHFIRGLSKMRLRCSLALVVMLATALGRIRQKEPEQMRSLVGST